MKQTIILNGFLEAQNKKQQLISKIQEEKIELGLATILVGDDPASHIYVESKIKGCQDVGIMPYPIFLPQNTNEQEILDEINKLNQNPKIHGILVQLPLPKHINSNMILQAIDPCKDVDCFHPYNVGMLNTGASSFAPATPTGILMLLELLKPEWSLESKNALVIGTSNIVGKPTAMLLLQKYATVTLAHEKTVNLKDLCLLADIIVSATGKTNLITEDMVKEGAVIIDVGMNKLIVDGKTKLVGDVDFENVQHKTFAITPVPRGVGPMTIAALLWNTYTLYVNHFK